MFLGSADGIDAGGEGQLRRKIWIAIPSVFAISRIRLPFLFLVRNGMVC